MYQNKKIQRISLIAIILFIIGMIARPFIKDFFPSNGEKTTEKKPTEKKLLNVNAAIVKYETLQEKIVSVGSILPDETVDLSFETSGKVVAIYFKEGTLVKKGDLLASINDVPLQAQLSKLKVQVPLAESRVYRQKVLLDKDAVSLETYEQVSTELATLKAEIEMIQAQIAQTQLHAPFDGYIGLRLLSEGKYASPATNIAKLTKLSPLKIEFSVPERYASQVGKGTKIKFFVVGSSKIYEAEVYAMDAEIDINTRTRSARAIYHNSNSEVVPGSYTSVEINMKQIDNTIAVPTDAVTPEMGIDKVFLYKNGKAVPQSVNTGLRTESKIQITEGLSIGDTIITSGVLQLRANLPVILEHIE